MMSIAEVASQLPATPKSILFVCGMNAIRSPMAEVIARSLLPQSYFISSAGVSKGEADPFVAAVLSEKNLPPLQHKPQALDEMGDDYFDIIITLSDQAHAHALALTRTQAVEVEHWPIEDPSTTSGTRTQILDAYRAVRDTLGARIIKRFGRENAQNNE